jgi:upstream activation factor subunit UAF30
MPKKNTSKSVTDSDSVPVPATVPATVPDSVSAQVSVDKKSRKPKAVKSDVNTSQNTVLASTSVSEVHVDTDVETPLAEQSIEFLAKLQQLGVLISSLKTEYRNLEKKWTREVKTAQKQSSKRKRKTGNRAPSGFVKPTKISDELASFLGKEKGTEMARTDVTREINTYIRAHKLQDKDNGRKINPDTKLATLLKLKKTDELTYFNLQKYMSPHFAKAIKVEVVGSV